MPNQKVFVYFNLRKKVWSIKALSGPKKGKVIAHANEVVIQDPEFRVSEAGRQRVLRQKRKNVHAGVAGGLIYYGRQLPIQTNGRAVTYNPYKAPTFTFVDDGSPARKAGIARLASDRKVYVGD